MLSNYNRTRIVSLIWLILAFSYVQAQETVNKDTADADKIRPIGYGSQPDWLITGARSSVSGRDLEKSFTSNLGATLFGRISGLTVMQGNNEPGMEDPQLLGRGIGTFGPNQGVLIIVDGFESSFFQSPPQEVSLSRCSRMPVLQPSMAAGVPMVCCWFTTKRGKEGALKINFGVQSGLRSPLKLPDFLGSYDYARLYNEARVNDGLPEVYSTEDLEAYRTGNDPYFHPDVNWYNELLRKKAPVTNYNLSFSGGSSSVRYFGLLNVLTDQGILIRSGDRSENSTNSKYNRYNFRSNIDIDLTKNLGMSMMLAGSVEDKANPVANTTASLFSTMASLPPNAFPVYNPNGTYGGTNLYTNPLGDVLEKGMFTSNGRTLQSALKLEHKLDMLTRGLKISASAAFNSYFRNYSSKSRGYERFMIEQGTDGEPIYTKYGERTSLVGSEGESEQWRNLTFQSQLDYDRSFGQNRVMGMLLYNMDSYSILGEQYPYKHLGGAGDLPTPTREIGEVSLLYGVEDLHRTVSAFPAVSLAGLYPKPSLRTILQSITQSTFVSTGNDMIAAERFQFERISVHLLLLLGTANTTLGGTTEGTPANPGITWKRIEIQY